MTRTRARLGGQSAEDVEKMPVSKPDTAELERLSAAAPAAADLARANADREAERVKHVQDRANRAFAVEQAVKACAVGGYEVNDIIKLARGFRDFLAE